MSRVQINKLKQATYQVRARPLVVWGVHHILASIGEWVQTSGAVVR